MAPHYDNNAEWSSRLANGQDDVEATSSGHLEVSYADDISSITLEDANRLAALQAEGVNAP